MTWPADRVGDKGQRYEVHCVGYPKDGDSVIGWHADKWKAADMGYAILKAPGAKSAYILDRRDNEIIDIEP